MNCLDSTCSLARHWDRAPQALLADEVRSWVVGRIERGLSPRTINAEILALRLFFADAMGQPDIVEGLRSRRIPDSLPRSIPEADVERLLQGMGDLRYGTATLTADGAGLRIAEAAALQVGDVQGEEGLPWIRSGKGCHERMAHLTGPRHLGETPCRKIRRPDRNPAIDLNGRNPLSAKDNQERARLRSNSLSVGV